MTDDAASDAAVVQGAAPRAARNLRWLATLLPVLGLLALVVRSELAQRGAQFRLAIAGYDPRDLISGHYLNYRYDLAWQGEPSCGVKSAGSEPYLDASCCVCLTRQGEHPAGAVAQQVSCSEVQRCAGWLYAEQLQPPQRYYVPEDRAGELERALAERKAAVDVVVSPAGKAAVGELYLDGAPWRTALEKHAPSP